MATLEMVRLDDRLYGEGKVPERTFEEILGESAALEAVLRDLEMVAPTDSTVLIQGETGTGKELIARAIHRMSSRFGQPFIKLNCAAIPSELLESELFGHERGAFTGALIARAGRFEAADKGTLFLDEIGDIPLHLQPKLLRALQEREIERLGSTRSRKVNIRVIAATHRDLPRMVEENQFRSDLFYRLHIFPLCLPPLRDRREDIPILVRHYVDHYARQMHRSIESIPDDAMRTMMSYDWPGNIRELQNFIERAVILSRGPQLHVPIDHVVFSSTTSAAATGLQGSLDESARKQIVRALEQCNSVLSGPHGAAVRLGMKRTTLQARMQKLGIRVLREPDSVM